LFLDVVARDCLRRGDVLSFPTRRASDLVIRRQVAIGFAPEAVRPEILSHWYSTPRSDCMSVPHPGAPFRLFHRHALGQVPRLIQDRKSTRLNSSHVSISYAVFCLKIKRV